MSIIEGSQHKTVWLDSRRRISGTNEDFLIEVKMPQDNKYTHVCALSINIPKSFYLLDQRRTFTLVEEGVDYPVVMDAGVYTRKQMRQALISKLNAAANHTYDVNIPTGLQPDTGLYTFTVTGNILQPEFRFDEATGGEIAEAAGFGFDTYAFVGETLTAPFVANMAGETSLHIRSDLTAPGEQHILQEVYAMGVPFFSNITYQVSDLEASSKLYIQNADQVYRFQLTSESGDLIRLNGQNITMALLFYRKERTTQLIQKAILASLQ